jgi:hypothetical protein
MRHLLLLLPQQIQVVQDSSGRRLKVHPAVIPQVLLQVVKV